jgi:ethanolamine ammonia-lyase large subunit
MDIGLQKIKTGANLWSIKKRIQNAREQILKTRPEAQDYIKGAAKSEEELLEAISFLTNLYEHAVSISRENTILANRNMEQTRIIKELENQIKYNKIENEI